MKRMSTSAKILLSLASLGTAGAIAGLGTYATFTSTTAATNQVTAGKVAIALGSPATGSLLSLSATNVVPNDTINRVVDLTNTSTDPLASVNLTTTATVSSVLDTNTTDGLKLTITACSLVAGWTVTGTAPAQTYTCPAGTINTVFANANIITTTGGGVALTSLNALTTAGPTTDHLLVAITLPSTNTSANLSTPPSSTISFSFVGTQRNGTLR
jgi:spore coat-associated protein N